MTKGNAHAGILPALNKLQKEKAHLRERVYMSRDRSAVPQVVHRRQVKNRLIILFERSCYSADYFQKVWELTPVCPQNRFALARGPQSGKLAAEYLLPVTQGGALPPSSRSERDYGGTGADSSSALGCHIAALQAFQSEPRRGRVAENAILKCRWRA
jgi:hypothetical protein